MLIFDSKKGRFGTQKPKQWGSLSAVRSSVFNRAAAIGLDPVDVKKIMPLWDNPFEYISGYKGVTNASCDSAAYDINQVVGNEISYGVQDEVVAVADTNFIINIDYDYAGYSAYQTLISQGSYDTGWLFYQYSDTNFYFRGDSAGDSRSFAFVPKDKSVTTIVGELSHFRVFENGQKIVTVSAPGGGFEDYSRPLALGARYNGTSFERQWTSSIRSAILLSGATATVNIAELINESPYYLLQPQSSKLIFDFGATAPSGWDHKIFGVTPSKVYGVEPTKVLGV